MTLNDDLEEFHNLIIHMYEDEQASGIGSVCDVSFAWFNLKSRLIDRLGENV